MVSVGLPWLLSGISLISVVLQGQKKASGWLLSLVNQTLWLTWIWASNSWGFLPLTLTLCFLFLRNYLKWRREALLVTL